jgi:periplasmic copper chaperone A
MRGLKRYLAGSVLTLALLAAAVPARAGSAASPPVISTSNAWIRWLPGALPAAAYVTLRNDGDRVATLISASSADYGSVMFHASRNQNGVEKMMPLESVPIAPHSQVSFAPRGLHIMLMQPNRSMAPGEQIVLVLRFADGASLPVRFEVRRPDGSSVSRKPTPQQQ